MSEVPRATEAKGLRTPGSHGENGAACKQRDAIWTLTGDALNDNGRQDPVLRCGPYIRAAGEGRLRKWNRYVYMYRCMPEEFLETDVKLGYLEQGGSSVRGMINIPVDVLDKVSRSVCVREQRGWHFLIVGLDIYALCIYPFSISSYLTNAWHANVLMHFSFAGVKCFILYTYYVPTVWRTRAVPPLWLWLVSCERYITIALLHCLTFSCIAQSYKTYMYVYVHMYINWCSVSLRSWIWVWICVNGSYIYIIVEKHWACWYWWDGNWRAYERSCQAQVSVYILTGQFAHQPIVWAVYGICQCICIYILWTLSVVFGLNKYANFGF